MRWLLIAVGFAVAVVVTAAVGAALHAQLVISRMAELGRSVPMSDRVAWTWHDVAGMFGTYAPIVAISFVLALPVAALVIRFLPRLRTFGYSLAGAVAIVAAMLVMKQLLDVTGIASARTAMGLLAQALAGAIGGWSFAVVSRRRAIAREAAN